VDGSNPGQAYNGHPSTAVRPALGISQEPHVTVHIQHIAAAWDVVEVGWTWGHIVKEETQFALRQRRGCGIVDIRDEKTLDTFAKPVECSWAIAFVGKLQVLFVRIEIAGPCISERAYKALYKGRGYVCAQL